MGKLFVQCSFVAILGETDGHPRAMLAVWIAPTGVQGLTRSCPGLEMGAGQPEDKLERAAELFSLCACVGTWPVDPGLPCRHLGQDLSASGPNSPNSPNSSGNRRKPFC